MTFAPVNGIELYYELHGPAVGTAPVILFAHGAGGNHLSWWQQVPHFRDRFTCVTIDHRGYGQSKDLPGRDSGVAPGGASFVEDLHALLDHLGIAKANLVAQSMGGWTCLGFTVKYPGRVEKLVMADTYGGLTGPAISAAQATAAGLPRPELPPGIHVGAGAGMAKEQPALAFLYGQMEALNPPRTAREMQADLALAAAPTEQEAAALQTPILFLIGEDDVVIRPVILEAAARCFPNATVARVPAAGHSVYFERPDRFNELVDQFLT